MLQAKGNQAEQTLAYQCLSDGLTGFEQEYRFDALRKYRLDLAFVREKVGIEINGGIWHGNAHSSPLMILRDMEKSNLLVLSGWRVLRFAPAQVNNGDALAGLKRLLEG